MASEKGRTETNVLYILAGVLIMAAIVIGLGINSLATEVYNVRLELREMKGIMRQQVQK